MTRYILNQLSARYEIVDTSTFHCYGESWVSFSDEQAAESFLRPFLDDFENRLTLRQLLNSAVGSDVFGLSTQAGLHRTAELLVEGRFRIRQYNEIDAGWETSFGYPLGNWQEMNQNKELEQQASNQQDEPEEETDWIEIQLVDDKDQAIVGQTFHLIQNNQVIFRGRTGSGGSYRVSMLIAGDYEIMFPDLDSHNWKRM